MFRVSINIFQNSQPRLPSQNVQTAPQAKSEAERQGDWSQEIKDVEKRLTEEDLRETFKDKFDTSGQSRLNKLA